MADPLPYIVSYSFSGFQANSPTTPLPAPQLDNELANAAAAIAALGSAIKDIRRPDGALQNGIVTFDSFELGLQLLVDPTNGELVAAAAAEAQAAAVSASGFSVSAGVHDTNAAASATAAAISAASVNLSLFLAKANNLVGLGSLATSRANLGLGTAAVLNVGGAASNIVQLDGSSKIPAYDGSQLTGIDVLPVGAIVWAANTVPFAGTLVANGSLVQRAQYPRLWAYASGSGAFVPEATWAAGSSGCFSNGDLSTTFRIPDLRGEFIRGWDNGRGVDASRAIGTNQADAFRDHTHTYTGAGQTRQDGTQVSDAMASPTPLQTGNASAGAGTETRPRNVALLPCIKY